MFSLKKKKRTFKLLWYMWWQHVPCALLLNLEYLFAVVANHSSLELLFLSVCHNVFSLIQLPYYQARRFWRPLLEKSFYYRRPHARSYMHICIHTCIHAKGQVIKWLLRRILMNDSQPIRRLIMNSDHHGNWLNQ